VSQEIFIERNKTKVVKKPVKESPKPRESDLAKTFSNKSPKNSKLKLSPKKFVQDDSEED